VDTAAKLVELAQAVTSGAAKLEEETPATYREAIECPDAAHWNSAMQAEFDACVKQETWVVVPRTDLPRGANILPVKWVFKQKLNEHGERVQFKARITPKGFKQKHGVDYFEVFAHTGKYKTLRIALALAAARDMEINQLDVPTAFVRADLEEEVYMEMPEGHREPGMVCHLRKSLYGLKQSPRNWYRLLSSFILTLGWSAAVSDPCLFHRVSSANRLMLLFVFVDDMQGFYETGDSDEWAETRRALCERFETKDLGDSKWMLGMLLTRNRAAKTIQLTQELYITKSLERYGLSECRSARTPMASSNALQDLADGAGDPIPELLYQEKIGVLLYAAISTRPDIAFVVGKLAQYVKAPLQRHMHAADRVFRYLSGTRTFGLTFGGPSRSSTAVTISAMSDADWASDKTDRKSVSGWIAYINGDAVSWQSKKQSAVALSTMESELYAECAATQELQWLRGFMKEIGVHHAVPILYGDSQSAIAAATNGVRTERSKHIDIKYRFITDVIARGRQTLQWISTHEQQADILTKALPAPQFEKLRKKIMGS
jgi:Reverse transcriptase (RNA-dependent DNA polymerase)